MGYPSFSFLNDKDFENNEMYIKLTKEKEDNNLDKWKIKIEGNDDYSMSKIFLNELDADFEWNNLLKLKYINKENLK